MRKKDAEFVISSVFFLLVAFFCSSCGMFQSKTAVLWTDIPEFALYAGAFNTAQDEWTLEVRYMDSPAGELAELINNEVGAFTRGKANYPDLVAGSWLKSSSTSGIFAPLDEEIEKGLINPDSFYKNLLNLGRINNVQCLLPIAFNLPAIVFPKSIERSLQNPFTITLAELRETSEKYIEFDKSERLTKMGFSPLWNDDFLYTMVNLFGANFREDTPLQWDNNALNEALAYGADWIRPDGDEFIFKYFTEPPSQLLLSGRISFAYMESNGFFSLTQEERDALSFRWLNWEDSIPLAEDISYLGICREGRAEEAAYAFVSWFYNEETQQMFLEEANRLHLKERAFGIAGGFSAIRAVTETVYPKYYPGLLGHVPPEDYLASPNILPRIWLGLKERVILPYLYTCIHDDIVNNTEDILRQRILEWYRSSNQRR